MKRSALTWSLVALEWFLALGGLFGGLSLISDPTGRSMQLPTERFLEGTPFTNYLVPGLILFTVSGVVPLVVSLGALMRLPWARFGHVAVGALLTGWMGVQIWLVGLSAGLQVMYLMVGLLILALGAMDWTDEPPPRRRSRIAYL